MAETLQTHLFQPREFVKRLVQETLFSLAQNGSLLGLMHLLILVLVVINRSMAGEAIRLSRRYVIAVFSTVWAFLIVSHVIFSVLQYVAITNLDLFFGRCGSKYEQLKCSADGYAYFDSLCKYVAINMV